jgi:RHS repeat-associated protein
VTQTQEAQLQAKASAMRSIVKASIVTILLYASFWNGDALAATKSCGTPGNPSCPNPPPLVGPWEFTLASFGGHPPAGPFDDIGSLNAHQSSLIAAANGCAPTIGAATPNGSPTLHLGIAFRQQFLKSITTVQSTGGGTCNSSFTTTSGDTERARTVTCPTASGAVSGGSGGIRPSCVNGEDPKKAEGSCKKNSGGAGAASAGGGGSIIANPCDVSNGNKYQAETDYRGPNGLSFVRSYNSLSAYNDSSFSRMPKPLGVGWMATYFQRLMPITVTDSTGSLTAVYALRPSGKLLTFVLYAGLYTPDADVTETLVAISGGYELRESDDTVETYDNDGKLLSIASRGGGKLTLSYAPDTSFPASVSDDHGHSLTFTYAVGLGTKSYKLASITDPAGGTISFAYNASNNLTSVTYPDSSARSYSYGATGNANSLTGLTDEAGNAYASWSYDGSGQRVLSSQHAGGVDAYSFTYLSGSGFRTVTDPRGVTRNYSQQLIQGTYRTTGISSFCQGCDASRVFDANGNANSITDFKGNVTTYSYDQDRNLESSRTEAFGTSRARTITTAWHSTFRLPTSVTELNRTTSFTHDANGNILTRTVTDTSVTPSVSRTSTYTYNAFGRVLTEDGPRTDVSDLTTFTYYTCTTGFHCGQVNTITNALGHVTTYNSYNAHGQPTQITDANNLVTTLAYDARQRLTDRCVGGTLPACTGGELTEIDYWPTGLLKKITSPDGSFIEYTYDAAHRLTEIEDGAGNRIVYTLDNAGNRTAENTYDVSSNLKRTHTQVFNSLNQLWKDVNAAGTAAVTTTFGYDNNGNQTSVAAPLSRNSSSTYDELNRLKQITDPASGVTAFGYDANDNLTSVTDPRSLVTSYMYNGFGDLKSQVSPDTGTTTNTYDTGGNLDTSTDARGAIADYAYDALNRVASVSYTLGGVTDQTISYTYDTGTNQKGHLTAASDANHSLSWTYDTQGRVTGKGQTVSAITKSIGYGYNPDGQLASMVLPSGKTITYGYNANNQVTSVTLNGSPAVTILNNITYDPFGPITGWTWGNATTASRVFDTDGKLTTINGQENKTFGYDDAFRITGVTDVGDSTKSWTLGYDLLDRLNAATKIGTTIGYTYDANGNRLSQTGTSASTYTMSGSSNKLTATSGVLSRSYSYDAVGNTTASGATVHSYNNANRMKAGRLAGGTDTTYVYNALGQRVKKSGGAIASPIYFMYDEAGHLVGEYDSSGNLIQETVWLGDIPVATLRPNGANVDVFYVHTDQLNTPRKVSRPSDNALRWKWDLTPFGEGTPDQNPASIGTFVYNLRFPGQQFDVETNLNYNYFRDYDPAVGRYTTSDPIGLVAGLNTFAYVSGNPLLLIDSLGLADCWPTWNRYKDYEHTDIRDVSTTYGPESLMWRPGRGASVGPDYRLPDRSNRGGGIKPGISVTWDLWWVRDEITRERLGYRLRSFYVTVFKCQEIEECSIREWEEIRNSDYSPWTEVITRDETYVELIWMRKYSSVSVPVY